MPQIIPIKDLKDTGHIAALCKQTSDPVFVTKNGYGEMVIMSIETYDNTILQADIFKRLGEAEKSRIDGKTVEGFEMLDRLKKKYEL